MRDDFPKETCYRLVVQVQVNKPADTKASHRLPIKTIHLQEMDSREDFTSFFLSFPEYWNDKYPNNCES